MVPRWGAGLTLLSAVHSEGWEIRRGHLSPTRTTWQMRMGEISYIYALRVCSPASSPVGIALLGCPGEVQACFPKCYSRWDAGPAHLTSGPPLPPTSGEEERRRKYHLLVHTTWQMRGRDIYPMLKLGHPLIYFNIKNTFSKKNLLEKNLEHNIKYLDSENVTMRFFKSLCNALRDSRICCCSSNHCCSL